MRSDLPIDTHPDFPGVRYWENPVENDISTPLISLRGWEYYHWSNSLHFGKGKIRMQM